MSPGVRRIFKKRTESEVNSGQKQGQFLVENVKEAQLNL